MKNTCNGHLQYSRFTLHIDTNPQLAANGALQQPGYILLYKSRDHVLQLIPAYTHESHNTLCETTTVESHVEKIPALALLNYIGMYGSSHKLAHAD